MTPEQQLNLAINIASHAHLNQYDKGGKPYILHPLYVMNQLLFDLELATIGVLHDVVEDCEEIDIKHLESEGFSERVTKALELLTHNPSDDYLDVYIQGICTNYDAIRVKRKDLEHNSDITRLKGVMPKDTARLKKYHEAFILLNRAKKEFQCLGL